MTTSTELATTPQEPTAAALAIQSAFEAANAQIATWEKRAADILVTSVDQKADMDFARQSRLAVRKIRIGVEHTRVEMKADALARGKLVDTTAKSITERLEKVEAHLLEQETFAERAEAQRRQDLAVARAAELNGYGVDPRAYASLGDMAEETWSTVIFDAQVAHENREKARKDAEAARAEAARLAEVARVEAERVAAEKAEADRVEAARLEAERVERERVQAEENARLKKEADEREAQMVVERAAAKAKADELAEEKRVADEAARVEREALAKKVQQAEDEARAAAKALADERAKADEEARRIARQQKEAADALAAEKAAIEAEAARKRQEAERAPDQAKLLSLAAQIRAIEVPALTSERGALLQDEVADRIKSLADWIQNIAN